MSYPLDGEGCRRDSGKDITGLGVELIMVVVETAIIDIQNALFAVQM